MWFGVCYEQKTPPPPFYPIRLISQTFRAGKMSAEQITVDMDILYSVRPDKIDPNPVNKNQFLVKTIHSKVIHCHSPQKASQQN